MAKPQPSATFTRGGSEISSGLVIDVQQHRAGMGERRATAPSSSSGPSTRTPCRPSARATAARSGFVEHGAELGQPALLLLELDHPEAPVVEDHELDRQVVGDRGDQVAEQHRQAAVAAERDHLPAAGPAPARRAPAACALAIEPRL